VHRIINRVFHPRESHIFDSSSINSDFGSDSLSVQSEEETPELEEDMRQLEVEEAFQIRIQ
jgi:hypothetical protein